MRLGFRLLQGPVSREFPTAEQQHSFFLSLRGRQRTRRFGGNVDVDVGEVRVDAPAV